MHVQSQCFANFKNYCFLTFSLTSSSSLLKVPNIAFPSCLRNAKLTFFFDRSQDNAKKVVKLENVIQEVCI